MLQDTPSPTPKNERETSSSVSFYSDAQVFAQGLLPRDGCADGPVPLDT